MAERIICPLCVQWRCSLCKSKDWPNCCLDGESFEAEAEPYWPDGSIAILTQQNYCVSCQKALEEYERQKEY